MQANKKAEGIRQLGSGAEYLYQTITGLAEHGIHDPYLWRIQRLVAEEISGRSTP